MKFRSALVAAALAALVGCNGGTAPTTAPPTVTPTPTVASSPSVTPTPTFSAETQAIHDGLIGYLRQMEMLMRDPDLTDVTALSTLTTGDQTDRAVQAIYDLRQRGRMVSGEITVMVESISDPTTSGGLTQSRVTYCRDLSERVFLDVKTRQPIDVPTAPVALREDATMQLMPNGRWAVAKVTNESVKSC